MAGKFNSRGNYHSFPNVRDFEYLLNPLRDPKVFPQGAFWPLVAPRRAGKTWALCCVAGRTGWRLGQTRRIARRAVSATSSRTDSADRRTRGESGR